MFSEKYGYKDEKPILVEKVSDELRRRIWNLFYQYEIKAGNPFLKLNDTWHNKQTLEEKILDRFSFDISNFENALAVQNKLKAQITSFFTWNEVYDFIEIHLSFLDDEKRQERIVKYNEILEQENVGYRIVLGKVSPITNASEIESIEEAANIQYSSVNQHIQKALRLYSDIQSPDYENSIKESISAVEAICSIITGITGKEATLGNTIKHLKDKGLHIHRAMESGFSSLYGYTSDENGIRHGGIDFTKVPAEDAKYMLVSCSAFINYLNEKWSKVKTEE